MKKIFGLMLSALLLSSTLSSKEMTEVTEVIALNELSSDLLEELLNGERPDLVIECKEGASLPIRFFHHLGFASVKCSPNLTVKLEKSCYLRIDGKKAYMSNDLATWEKASRFMHDYLGKTKLKLKIGEEDSSLTIETSQKKA